MIFQNFYINTAVILIISYLIGSFPSAYIAGRIRGIDIRNEGSGNVGGMNAISNTGRLLGVAVIIIDITKGVLCAYIASIFSNHVFVPLLAVVFAVIGHNWMLYIGFRGGKGVSTFLGGLLYLSPLSFLFLYLIFIPVALFIVKDSYVSTALGFFSFSFFLLIYERSFWWLIFGLLITILYSIKSFSLLKDYYTKNRKDVSPAMKKIFKPFFKGM